MSVDFQSENHLGTVTIPHDDQARHFAHR